MLFKILPMSSLGAGPEFYNNPFASNNTVRAFAELSLSLKLVWF